MNALFLALLLSCSAAEKKADADTVKLVNQVLKVQIADIPPEAIEAFLAVDGESLPKKIQKRFEARKIELYTLKHLADGKKKKSNWRIINPEECSRPKESSSQEIGLLMLAGFGKVSADEVAYTESKSKCTQRDMMCEFSLQVIIEKKGKEEKRTYLIHGNDPLMAYVSEYRAGMSGGNTNFFGMMKANCTH